MGPYGRRRRRARPTTRRASQSCSCAGSAADRAGRGAYTERERWCGLMMWMLMRMRMLMLITGLRNHQLAIRVQLAIRDQVNTESGEREHRDHRESHDLQRASATSKQIALRPHARAACCACAIACISAREMSAWGDTTRTKLIGC